VQAATSRAVQEAVGATRNTRRRYVAGRARLNNGSCYASDMPEIPSAQWFALDERERGVVAETLRLLANGSPEQAALVDADLDRLTRLARLVDESPSITRAWPGRKRGRQTTETLLDLLCRVPEYDFELHIPTRAVLGQAWLVARINFLKSVSYAGASVDAPRDLGERARAAIDSAIYAKMIEELLISILTQSRGERVVQVGAGRRLFRIWESRLDGEADDYTPVLSAAWEARTKVPPAYGTMLGVREIFRLFQEARDDRFLDYFGREDRSEEEMAAFEEFLFGLSYEEVTRLRSRSRTATTGVVTRDDARDEVSSASGLWVFEGEGPQALYASYQRRRVKARYRSLTGVPGPKRAAEEYALAALLREAGAGEAMATRTGK
jgi:hypothetical protein